jgi:ATP-binding cassette subfamily B protein
MCNGALAALLTAMSGRLQSQVDAEMSSRYFIAVVRVELGATERADVQRVIEAGQFGIDAAGRSLSVLVNVASSLMGMVSSMVVLLSLNPLLLTVLAGIAIPKGWAVVLTVHREHTSRHRWIDNGRATNALVQHLTMPQAAGELRVHEAGSKLLGAYREIVGSINAEQRRLASSQASTQLVSAAISGAATVAGYGLLWWLLTSGGMPIALGGTAVIAIQTAAGRLTTLVSDLNHIYEDMLRLSDTEEACRMADEFRIRPAASPCRNEWSPSASKRQPRGVDGPAGRPVPRHVSGSGGTVRGASSGEARLTSWRQRAGVRRAGVAPPPPCPHPAVGLPTWNSRRGSTRYVSGSALSVSVTSRR